jgi:hypothetical protein
MKGIAMKLLSAAALAALLVAGSADAQQVAAPLGLEVGKATCADARAAAGPAAKPKPDTSAWSGGPLLKFSRVAGFGMDDLQAVTVVCNLRQTIIAVELVFPKEGRSGVKATVAQLDRKYKPLRREIPFVGSAFAEWQTANGTVLLEAPHLSFTYSLTYWTSEALVAFDKWTAAERSQREQKRAGNL